MTTLFLTLSLCKRLCTLLVVAIFAVPAYAQTIIPAFLKTSSSPPAPEAKSWVLLESKTGWILTSGNENNRADPASLTKLMTAYLAFDALEKGKINGTDKVIISKKAWQAPGSRMFLKVDTSASINELIHGLIVQSGNDAAIALAEKIGGSESGFAGMMNETANRMGMLNTHYVNASGLPAEGHYTTAYDTALLSRALIQTFPDLYALFSIREYTYNEITQANRNSLLWRDDTYDGLKTGHTQSAGYCLAGSAERDNTRFIGVVMGADSNKSRVRGVSSLVEFGFSQYETVTVFGPTEPVQDMPLYKGEVRSAAIGSTQPISIVVPKGQHSALEIRYELPEKLLAPLTVSDTIGSAELSFKGASIGRVEMRPMQDYALGSIWTQLLDAVRIKLF